MKILFFEFALAVGYDDKQILKEGSLMYNTLLKQFLNLGEVITILDKQFIHRYKINNNLTIVEGNEHLENILEEIIKNNYIDYALIIAPEEENILYNLTKILEENKIKNLGSSSNGVKIAGDKYLSYLTLKDTVKMPNTYLGKYVIKKRDGCGGKYNFVNENYIIQEYVDGETLSVSLIVGENKIYFLSLNRQFINNGFKGAEVNIFHNRKEEIFNEVKKAVKKIPGLFGYVGVDVIVNEDIYVVDINPRITTTIYKLHTSPSLAKLLIDNKDNKVLKYSVSGERFYL